MSKSDDKQEFTESKQPGITPINRANFALQTVLQLYAELPSDMGLEDVRGAYMSLQNVLLRLERSKKSRENE